MAVTRLSFEIQGSYLGFSLLLLWGHSLIACKIQNGRLRASKWLMGSGQFFGLYHQLLLYKFFDSSTPSMKKVDNGEKEKKNKRKEK